MSAAASSPAKRKRSGSMPSPPQPQHPPPRRRSRRNEAINHNNMATAAASMDIEDVVSSTSTTSAFASPSLPPPIDPRPPMPLAPSALLTSMERRALGLSGLLLAAFVGDAAEFAKEAHRVSTLSSSSSSPSSSSSSSSSASTAWGRLDARGRSVLHAAASSGHPTILQHVLAAQMIDIDTEAEGGLTALCYSLDRRDLAGATTLLAAGADPGKIEEIYGLWDSEWASEKMGLFNTSRVDALAILKVAVCAAVALKDERARPWLDGETQLLLFEGWKAKLKVGSRVDARDCDYRWYEAEVIGVFSGGVRVSYLSWGKRFDEDLGLDSLRVLPAYSVVPAWRETLAVGSQVEILAAAAEAGSGGGQGVVSEGVVVAAGGGGGGGGGVGGMGLPSSPSHVRWEEKERKWWDATALDIDRRQRMVLLSVDGRPSLSRWVEIDKREIADIGTHVKPPAGGTLAPPLAPPPPLLAPPHFPHPFLLAGGVAAAAAAAAAGGGGGLFIPPRGGKEPVPATTRQIQAREAANAGDLPTLLSFINVQDPAALRLTYYRRKLHLVAAYSPEAPTRGVGCPLLTARREKGVPEFVQQQKQRQQQREQQQQQGGRSAKKARVSRWSSSGSSSSSSSSSSSGRSSVATMSYAEKREVVLRHVVTELNEDLFVDLLLEYW